MRTDDPNLVKNAINQVDGGTDPLDTAMVNMPTHDHLENNQGLLSFFADDIEDFGVQLDDNSLLNDWGGVEHKDSLAAQAQIATQIDTGNNIMTDSPNSNSVNNEVISDPGSAHLQQAVSMDSDLSPVNQVVDSGMSINSDLSYNNTTDPNINNNISSDSSGVTEFNQAPPDPATNIDLIN